MTTDPGPEAEAEEADWVEILRVHDRFEADVTATFLKDHDVPVQMTGGANTAIPTLALTDMRLLVPRAHLERAGLVLNALNRGGDTHPFRDAPPDPYEKPVVRRKAPFAAVLALMVPIGGGHFYARHGAAGTVLAAGIVGGAIGVWLGMVWLSIASGLLILADIAFSPGAVRRANRDEVPGEWRQRAWAMGAVVIAYAVALSVGR